MKHTRHIVYASIIGALYAVLVVGLAPLSFHILQFRAANLLKALAICHPAFAFGFGIGNFFANQASPFGVLDWGIMPLFDIVGALTAYQLRRWKWAARGSAPQSARTGSSLLLQPDPRAPPCHGAVPNGRGFAPPCSQPREIGYDGGGLRLTARTCHAFHQRARCRRGTDCSEENEPCRSQTGPCHGAHSWRSQLRPRLRQLPGARKPHRPQTAGRRPSSTA